MNLTTSHTAGAVVLRIDDARLTYPSLSDFASTATALIGTGERRIVIDLGAVGYVDSAAIGCLMDLHRQATTAGSVIKLASLQKRVETMLTMTGAHHFLEVHPDSASALASFGG